MGFRWQFYPSLSLTYRKCLDQEYKLYHHYLILGPLQMTWVTQ